MRLKPVVHCAIAAALAALTGACSMPRSYSGPGCLIYIYSQPDLKGYGLPIRSDTERLADPWPHLAASAKIIYGSWRLYSEPEFNGFMGDYRAPSDVRQLTPDHHLGSLKCVEPAPEPAPGY